LVLAREGADREDDLAWRGSCHRWLGWDSDPRSAGYESAALGQLSYPAFVVRFYFWGPAAPVRRRYSSSVSAPFLVSRRAHERRLWLMSFAPPRVKEL